MSENIILTYQYDYKELYEHGLIIAKIGSLLLFAVATLVYQIKFKSTKSTSTMFNSVETTKETLIISSLASLLSAMSVLYIGLSRGWSWIDIFLSFMVVLLLLFAFEISTESSGFNRFLASDDTAQGKGVYYELDKKTDPNYIYDEQIRLDSSGSPFVISVFIILMLSIFSFFMYVLIRSLMATYYGYSSGNHFVDNVQFFDGSLSHLVGFGLEIAIMFGLNFAGQILPDVIMREKIRSFDYGSGLVFGLSSVLLHVMDQYVGLY